MESESKLLELQTLVDAIRSTHALENQIPLINQLAQSHICNTSDLHFVAEFLVTFWLDSTCLGLSQCMINMTILQVAGKLFMLDSSIALVQLVLLGTKASIWCGKHLQSMILSESELQDEEHKSLLLTVILESLGFSSTAMVALIKSPVIGEKAEILIIENFILEALSLTKASILENKKIEASASKVLKAAQTVLDSTIKLCRAYSQAIKWNSCEQPVIDNEESPDTRRLDYADHVVSIVACTINCLYELGIFAASGGGSLVTVLNASWKGLVSLLQLGKRILVEKINIGDIILSLVSLATESLRCAADAFLSLREDLSVPDAKRAFLPVKFYLINAVRISSEYPCEAMKVYQEILRSVLIIATFGIFLSKELHLAAGSEALSELLEPTSYLLVHTLLSAADVSLDNKFNLLGWLFPDHEETDSTLMEEDSATAVECAHCDSIFLVECEAIPKSKVLTVGRVLLFVKLLKNSPTLREEIVPVISKKLSCLLDLLTHDNVYPYILCLTIPILNDSVPNTVVVRQSVYCFLLTSIKTFMIVACSSQALLEVQSFLFENLFHPHFLCKEIIEDLWCFLMRHADTEMINPMLGSLCLLLRDVASSEPILMPLCSLRKVARSICIILTYAKPASLDHVYRTILNDDDFYLSSIMYVALLMEGFPLSSLSDKLKTVACRKILSTFEGFMESFPNELPLSESSRSRNSGLYGLPLYALSSAVNFGEIKNFDLTEEKNISKFLKFTLSLINTYKSSSDSMKDHYRNLLSATLDVIANMKQLYSFDEIGEVFLELKALFLASTNCDLLAYQCKPSLAAFMSGICHMELSDSEDDVLCSAVVDLFHVLLRDRHWAFSHLAISAFGYFAARTTYTKLWRFVPQDAALSFDKHSSSEAKEEIFMSELKGYLEKEGALTVVTPEKQLGFLAREGMVLRNMRTVYLARNISERNKKRKISDENWEAISEVCVEKYRVPRPEKPITQKKRKIPDGICEGLELLQNGLRVVNNALARAKSDELNEAFLTHVSCLNDVISHLLSLSEMS